MTYQNKRELETTVRLLEENRPEAVPVYIERERDRHLAFTRQAIDAIHRHFRGGIDAKYDETHREFVIQIKIGERAPLTETAGEELGGVTGHTVTETHAFPHDTPIQTMIDTARGLQDRAAQNLRQWRRSRVSQGAEISPKQETGDEFDWEGFAEAVADIAFNCGYAHAGGEFDVHDSRSMIGGILKTAREFMDENEEEIANGWTNDDYISAIDEKGREFIEEHHQTERF